MQITISGRQTSSLDWSEGESVGEEYLPVRHEVSTIAPNLSQQNGQNGDMPILSRSNVDEE